MGISPQQYNDIIRKPAIAKLNPVGSEASSPQPEQAICHEPMAAKKRKAGNTARFRLCIVSRRVRLIDPDNLCGKYFTDCCRYAGLLSDDRASVTDYSISQTKVKTKEEECTVITIEPL